VGAQAASERAHDFATGSGAQTSPDRAVNAVADRSSGAVHQEHIDRTAVVTARGDGGVRRSAGSTVSTFLPRVVVTVVRGTADGIRDERVGGKCRGEAFMVNAAVRPFGVTGRFEPSPTGHCRLYLGQTVWHVCRWRTGISRVRLPGFHFGRHQRVARPVQKIAESQPAVREKRSVPAAAGARIKNKPSAKVESVSRGIEGYFAATRVASLVTFRVARARVHGNLDRVDGGLEIPRNAPGRLSARC